MKKLYNLFLLPFVAAACCITLLTLIRAVTDLTIFLFFGLITATVAVAGILLKKYDELFSDRNCKIFAGIFFACLFAVQVFYCLRYPYQPKTGDYEAIYTAVREFVRNGRLTDSNLYFLHHPHQRFSFFFYAAFNYLVTLGGRLGEINLTATTILNAILCCLGGCLLFVGVQKQAGSRCALLTALLFCLHNGYFASNNFLYSHALSVFFVCLTLCCFCFVVQEPEESRKLFLILLLGFAIGVAKSVEGIITISLVAAAIYFALNAKNFLNFLLRSVLLAAGFLAAVALISTGYIWSGIFDFTNAENEKLPLTHWIMIGLNEDGGYSEDDYQAMVNLPTSEDKRSYASQQIRERLQRMDVQKLLELCKLKEEKMWVGSVYGYHLGSTANRYNIGYKLALYVLILAGCVQKLSSWGHRRLVRIEPIAFGYLWIFGIFLFALLWESSTIYLFSSMPLLIFAAGKTAGSLLLNKPE